MLDNLWEVLLTFVEWIDSQQGKEKHSDLPIPYLKQEMECYCDFVKEALGFDAGFGLFRLQVFMTLINGAGLTQDGRHRRQMFFPVEGTAAYNHLKAPSGDTMSSEQAESLFDSSADMLPACNDSSRATIDPAFHDDAMQVMSKELGFLTYFRDTLECCSCQSMHSRRLCKKEWFTIGCPMYDLDGEGWTLVKAFGRYERWKVLAEVHDRFANRFSEDATNPPTT